MGDRSPLEARLAELGATRLWLTYHDYAGIACAKAVGADRLTDVGRDGVTWAKANWDFAITDHQVPHPGFAADSGDLRLVPDPATIRPLPHRPGVALAYGWFRDADDTPWPGDPRARLAAAEEALRERGAHVRVGVEAEFALYRPPTAGTWEPADRGAMFTQAALDASWELLGAVLDGLEAMEIGVHQVAKEYGPGQYEVSLLPSAALEAIDRWLAARDLIKALAHQHGLVATFMPKPRDDLAGNGLHLHLSLESDEGWELIPDPADPAGLSADGHAAVAGLLEHAAAQAALGCPTPNSYKRLLPGSWAPAHVMWAFGNRAALVRVPGPGDARRLEYRGGDGGANLYLHATGLLAAIRDGLERRPAVPTQVASDVGHLSDANARALGAARLPSRLDLALDALERDPVLCEAIGPIITKHYLAVKRFEWESYLDESGLGPEDTGVSDWERTAYLEAL